MNETLAGINIFVALFLLVLAVLWLLLPFAVFGIKNRLDRMLSQSEKVLKQLEHMTGHSSGPTKSDQDTAGGGWS